MIPDFTKESILALSWKAPYAQLMLRGKIETRKWKAKYLGWVLICCSKMPYTSADLYRIAGKEQFDRIVGYGLTIPSTTKDFGYAIAIGKLVDCRLMIKEDENACFVKFIEPWHENITLANGKRKSKRNELWCHVYENVIPIQPFEFTGAQGWKRLTEEEIQLITPIK